MMANLNLNKREKIFVCTGAVILFLTLLYTGVIAPYNRKINRLDSQIALRQSQVQKVVAMKDNLLSLQQQILEAEQKSSKSENFSLFSFIEQKVQRVAGKENLVYMRPQPTNQQEDFEEISIEVKLDKINLNQVVRFLFEIEKADVLLNVKNLQLKNRAENASLLNATINISTLRKKP